MIGHDQCVASPFQGEQVPDYQNEEENKKKMELLENDDEGLRKCSYTAHPGVRR